MMIFRYLQIGGQEFLLRSAISVNLPPRTKTLITVPIRNAGRREGYIRRLDTAPGVHVGEALATQENGFAKIFAFNTTLEHVTLSVPPVELEEFSEISPSARSARTGNPGEGQSRADAARLVQLVKLLDMQDLNESERASILEIINEFPYQFYLPSDPLGSTLHIIRLFGLSLKNLVQMVNLVNAW